MLKACFPSVNVSKAGRLCTRENVLLEEHQFVSPCSHYLLVPIIETLENLKSLYPIKRAEVDVTKTGGWLSKLEYCTRLGIVRAPRTDEQSIWQSIQTLLETSSNLAVLFPRKKPRYRESRTIGLQLHIPINNPLPISIHDHISLALVHQRDHRLNWHTINPKLST